MIGEMQKMFQADAETAEGLYAFARMALGEIHDASNSLKKILKPILDQCTPEEKRSFINALLRLADVEGPASEVQHRLIGETRRAVLN